MKTTKSTRQTSYNKNKLNASRVRAVLTPLEMYKIVNMGFPKSCDLVDLPDLENVLDRGYLDLEDFEVDLWDHQKYDA